MKQRLVGAAVLVALAVVFIPMLLDETGTPDSSIKGSNIPPKPPGEFTSRIVPLDAGQAPAEGAPKGQPAALPSPAGAPSPAPSATGPTAADQAAAQVPAGGAAKIPPSPKPAGQGGSPAVRVGVTAWVIQLGSFSSKDNADSLEARLRKEGYSAFVEKTDSDDGPVYRVRVGPELLRAKADELRERLEKDVKLKGIVVRYP